MCPLPPNLFLYSPLSSPNYTLESHRDNKVRVSVGGETNIKTAHDTLRRELTDNLSTAPLPSSSSLVTLINYGQLWSTLVNSGQLWSTVVNSRQISSTLSTLVDNYGQLWSTFSTCLGKSTVVNFGQLWSTLVNCGQLWSTMVNSSQIWSPLVNWFQRVHPGHPSQLWSTLVNFGQLWSTWC